MEWMVRGQWDEEMAAWLVFLFAVSCHVSDFTWMASVRRWDVFGVCFSSAALVYGDSASTWRE